MRWYEIKNLLEYKSEVTIQKMGDKLVQAAQRIEKNKNLTAQQVLQGLEKMDPTKNRMYMMWIIKQYADKKMRLEDYPRINDAIDAYHKAKPQLPQEHRDIGKFDLHSLEQLVDKFAQPDSELSKDVKYEHLDDMEILYNGPHGLLAIPKTTEASCELGSGTKWCTAAKKNNLFKGYAGRGNLYVWIQKPGNEKYQFWVADEGLDFQFMDSRDIEIGFNQLQEFRKHPVVGKVLNKLIANRDNALLTNLDGVIGEMSSGEFYHIGQWIDAIHGGQWPEFEQSVLDLKQSYSMGFPLYYAWSVKGARWPEAEKLVAPYVDDMYSDEFEYVQYYADEFLDGDVTKITDGHE